MFENYHGVPYEDGTSILFDIVNREKRLIVQSCVFLLLLIHQIVIPYMQAHSEDVARTDPN